MFKDIVKFLAGCAAVITFILTLGHGTVDLFVNWNIISLSGDGMITIVPFVKAFWYVISIGILSFAAFCFLLYKSIFDGRYFFEKAFFAWLSIVLEVVWCLARPVPWYGLTLGLFFLFVLGWLFVRQVRILHFGYKS